MSISAFIKYVEVFYDFSFIESIRDVSFHSFWFTYNLILENNKKIFEVDIFFVQKNEIYFLSINTKSAGNSF